MQCVVAETWTSGSFIAEKAEFCKIMRRSVR